MPSGDPRLQSAAPYAHPHVHRTAASQPPPPPPPQQPLNPSAYASSNPPPRLPRIHPSSEAQAYPSHPPAVQQQYYSTPPQTQLQAVSGTTTPTQRYGSPHYRGDGPPDVNEADASPTDGNDVNDPKRSRACESCRSLKVRCDQDPENPDAPCKRCAKANRQCVITAPSRKRQKKTDSRVAELEKKIDALTSLLKSHDQHGMSVTEANPYRYPAPAMSSPDSTYSPESQSSRRAATLPHRDPPGRDSVDGQAQKRPLSTDPYERQYQSQVKRVVTQSPADEEEDTETVPYLSSTLNSKVDKIMSERTAAKIFDRYVLEMSMHMPAVVFPSQTTAHQVRKSKPILFLSILVAASVGMMPVAPQEELTGLLKETLATCVMRYGGKSIELVQALFLTIVWYRPPKRYEQMNFYQLTHIAAIMAIDIGLGRRMNMPKNQRPPTSSEQTTRIPKHLFSSNLMEARRTWLGCYFMCSNVAMTLRRPNLIRWNAYMDECVEVLETADDALPSDKALCQFVKLQHINEEVGQQFLMDDPSATITISDSPVQYALKVFESQLSGWSKAASASTVWNARLQFNEHVAALYMHEVALHINHNVDDFRAPFTEESLRAASGQCIVLSAAHSKALTECLAAAHGCFQAFFNFDIPTIKALPIFYFVRIAYAVVVLIKLFFAVTAPGSEVGKIISQEDLQVEHHVDTLLRILHTIDDEESFRPAKMFLLILTKLHHWFKANRENKNIPRDASRFNPWASFQHAEDIIKERRAGQDTPNSQRSDSTRPASQQQQFSRPSNTSPLHVFAEVATNSSNANMLSSTNSPGAQMQRISPGQQQSQQMPAYYAGGGGSAATNMGYDPSAVAVGGELNIGDGFGQAIGMALGAADDDLSNFFMNDPMFNFGAMPDPSTMHYFQGQGW